MRALRAFLFNVLFFAGTTALCICMVPLMPFGRKANQLVGHMWCHLTQGALAISVGMYKRIRGLENLPKGPCILVAKHQSAWETLTFHTVVPDPAYILKKELTRIPLMGQFLLFSGQIAVDRSAGSSALKDMIKGAERALEDGRQIVIFPEGTRTPSRRKLGQLQRGVANIAIETQVDLIPVVVHCNHDTLKKGVPWYRIPPSKIRFRLVVDAPLSFGDIADPTLSRAKQARLLTRIIKDYYLDRLTHDFAGNRT